MHVLKLPREVSTTEPTKEVREEQKQTKPSQRKRPYHGQLVLAIRKPRLLPRKAFGRAVGLEARKAGMKGVRC